MAVQQKKSIKFALSTGASLAMLSTILTAQPTFAQSTATPQTPDSAPAEIVVTAQRREQKLQDVGIAVTVLGRKDIAGLNITNATDVVRAIPNLKFNAYSSSQVVFNVRGVSQNDYGDQQEPPVAVYQDDSYASSITTASFPIFDLARVEALRGPQGTLFGRNATGGAVQFISSQPTKSFSGYLTGTYGRYNQTILEGGLSGPLTDNLSVRIAGIYDKDDGYIHNITPGQADRGADNHWALRGIVAFEPSSAFKAKLTLRYTQADRERQAGTYTFAPACPNAQLQGEFLSASQSCSFWGTGSGQAGNGYTNPAITPSQGGNPWTTAGTGDAYVNRNIFGTTLRMDATLGNVALTSISDYTNLSKFYIESGDGPPELPYVPGTLGAALQSPGPCASPAQSVTCYPSGTIFYQQANTNQYSQEIRAAAKMGNNYLVVGAYGLIIDGKFKAKYATPFDGYDPTVTISQRTESYALFAQDEWKFSEKFKLVGGLRFWHDKKVGTYAGQEAYTGLSINFGPKGIYYNPDGVSPNTTTGVLITPAAASPSYSGVTARAELDYKPSRDTLIYASYNRGSKSGGFTFSTGTPFPSQIIDTLNNIPYRPETLNDYEIGLKTKLGASSTFNIAAYYYDYQNYQAFVQVGFTQVVRNLPATNKGIEADLTTHPIHGLTVQLSGAVQDSEVKNVLLPDGTTLVNHNLPQAPGFSANALVRYEFALAGGKASVQADALYSGKFCFTVLCAPVENEPAYHVENARIGFTPKGSNLDLAVFVNNLFNRAYRIYAFDGSQFWGDALGVYAKPRTWGVTASYHFGK